MTFRAEPSQSAAIAQPTPSELALSGHWTALELGGVGRQIESITLPSKGGIVVDGSAIDALDTAGAWILQKLLQRLRDAGNEVQLQGCSARFSHLIEIASRQPVVQPPSPNPSSFLERLGRNSVAASVQAFELLAFAGESAIAFGGWIICPRRVRWRPVLHNIRSAGFDALPIIGLLSFLLGIVIAYQGADQLRRYGANIFVADLVGLSMLREFAPLMTAIIVAGRSGSAYAAQIGTMSVTEEIDAMRTIGIAPIEQLVLPKMLALVIVLPLLTLFADMLGVLGGMLMAQSQLGVGFTEFLDRMVKAVSVTAYLIGIGKAPVFAAIIALIGCFQGFRTRGGADSVGRQTTLSVVQSTFLVIVADAMFSIFFSILDL